MNCLKDGEANNVVLMSHLGRPDGQKIDKYSLKPTVSVLEDLLGKKVRFLDDCMGSKVLEEIKSSKDCIFLLENLRFYVEEEGKGVNKEGEKVKADKEAVIRFRERLTSYGDIYVNDAFGTSHRAHSSIVGVELETRVAGLLLKKELDYFGQALENPKRPLLVILGGAKVSDKIKLIENILDVADEVIIGGGMAFTFLKVIHNMSIGNSKFDLEGSLLVGQIMNKAKQRNVKIILPVDFMSGDSFSNDCLVRHSSMKEGVSEGWIGMDCGLETIELNRQAVSRASTIIWNGP